MTKILIADDEPNILLLSQMLFQDMGMDVVTAMNGEEAIQKAIAERPDLVITDVVMPKKSGFEVCRTLRATPETADTPIIILSAMGDEYNKITGFEGGADDYITKPFSIEELKARAKALLIRRRPSSPPTPSSLPLEPSSPALETPTDNPPAITYVSTGLAALDAHLFGGFPRGSNILVLGPIGKGKSTFCREFIAEGLRRSERCLFVALDDNPKQVRQELNAKLPRVTADYEASSLLRIVDAYSWTTMSQVDDEPFSISGTLELNQLAGCIADAGSELGHTIQSKLGGRRVIDSISSLLINFDLPSAQRFLSQISRTAISFGQVTTLFILEEGTVTEQVLNNVKYLMDGVLEFSEKNGQRVVRVSSMKWAKYNNQWVPY
jgi:CheY-like chemotaxis protein/KaiC/GvpD/RAD55 family RecA-like ATPase